MSDFEPMGWTDTPISLDYTLSDLDPELLNLLTGWTPGTERKQQVSIEIKQKIRVKRTFWQWLLRRPIRYTEQVIFIPRADVSGNERSE